MSRLDAPFICCLLRACRVDGLSGSSQQDRDISSPACSTTRDAIKAFKRDDVEQMRGLLDDVVADMSGRESEALASRVNLVARATTGTQAEADAVQSLFAYCFPYECDPKPGRRETCVTKPIPTG